MSPTRRPLPLLLLLLALAAGLLVACGEDEKADYAEEVEQVLQPLGENLQRFGTTISGAESSEAIADGLSSAQEDLDEAASSLAALSVPEDVEAVNEGLVAALRDFSQDLDGVREAAESGDSTALEQAARELPQASEDFEQELGRVQEEAIEAGVPIEAPE